MKFQKNTGFISVLFGFRSDLFPVSGNNLTSGLFFRSGGSSLLLLPLLGLLLTSTTSASGAFSQLLVISDTDHGIFVSVCDRFDLQVRRLDCYILKNGYSSLISHEILVSVSDASEELIVTDF